MDTLFDTLLFYGRPVDRVADGGWYFKLKSLDVATEQCCLVKWLDTEIPVGIKYAYRNNQQEGDPF